jgi:cold shock CspA family protein
MSYGTVRWFNAKTGAGFIRTDEGENVLFLIGAIRDSDPSSIYRGVRVYLDIREGKYGLTGINVRATELQAGRE